MANKNRTEVSAAIQAVSAVVGETSYKATLDDNFAQSVVFRKDVASSDTATTTKTIDWTGVDYFAITQTGNTTYTLSNIEQGEIKYLKITKGSGDTISLSAGTIEDSNTLRINAMTAILFEVFNKDGNLQLRSITDTKPIAGETIPGLTRLATTAEAEAFVNDSAAMTSLKVNEQREEKFSVWTDIAYDAGDFTGWTGSASGFSARYLKIGKTVHFVMEVTGTPSGSASSLWYDLPAAISNDVPNGSALSVLALVSGVYQPVSGAHVVNDDVRVENSSNFSASAWTFQISGTWEIE